MTVFRHRRVSATASLLAPTAATRPFAASWAWNWKATNSGPLVLGNACRERARSWPAELETKGTFGDTPAVASFPRARAGYASDRELAVGAKEPPRRWRRRTRLASTMPVPCRKGSPMAAPLSTRRPPAPRMPSPTSTHTLAEASRSPTASSSLATLPATTTRSRATRLSITMRDVRVIRDILLAAGDWNVARLRALRSKSALNECDRFSPLQPPRRDHPR